jgi:O-methyltransferase involved in polyketide biosynthesis
MTAGRWVPDGVEVTVPSPGRVYHHALGGLHSFATDRTFWDAARTAYPDGEQVVHAGRAFLARAVRRLLDTGIRQFLDVGAGIPDIDSVHEIIAEHGVDARVVYADIDPVTVELAQRLLTGHPGAWAIHGDLRAPGAILDQAARILDLGTPVAVLAGTVLQFLTGSDAAGLLERVGADVVAGSYLVVSHATPETTHAGRARQEAGRRLYAQTPMPMVLRRPDEITALLGDAWQILPPGVTTADHLLPDPHDDLTPRPPGLLAVIARRRGRPPDTDPGL